MVCCDLTARFSVSFAQGLRVQLTEGGDVKKGNVMQGRILSQLCQRKKGRKKMGKKLVLVLTLLAVVGLWTGSSAGTGKSEPAMMNRGPNLFQLDPYSRTPLLKEGEKVLNPLLAPSPDDTIHYDGTPDDNAIGLTGGGTFQGAIRLTPTELGSYTGWEIVAVIWYHHEAGSHGDSVIIYDQGTDSTPGPVLTSDPCSDVGPGWAREDLSNPVAISGLGDLWCSIQVTHADGEFPLSTDPGPAVQGKGDFVYLAPNWDELWLLGFNINWDIRAIVDSGAVVEWGAIDGTVSELGGGPIQDAVVTADGNVDTTDASGYYLIDVLAGTYDVTASAFGYNPATTPSVVVVLDDTVTVDFDLTYPLISVDPTSFYVTLAPDIIKDTTLWIYNTGNGPLDFDIDIFTNFSVNAGKSVRPPGETSPVQITGNSIDASATDARHVKSEPKAHPNTAAPAYGDVLSQFNAPWAETNAGAGLSYDPNTGNLWAVNQSSGMMYEIDPVAQVVVSSWAIPLTLGWGCGFDGSELWVSDVNATNDDYEFSTTGLGPLDQFTPIYTSWPADMAFDGQWLWQIDVGSPGAVYQYDFDGNPLDTIQPGYSISQRGLACNRDQGTWYSGSWNTPLGQFWEFDAAGATVNYVVTGIAISGLAWDGVTGNIWCMANASPDVIYELDSGYPAPTTWLDANPRTDSVAAVDSFAVTVTFNSTGLAVGVYTGGLAIHNNSIDSPIIVPCTLEVVLVGVEEAGRRPGLPRVHALSQNSPNPMRGGSATISYQLAAEGDVSLKIYNAAGRLVKSLAAGPLEPGYYKETWDGRDSSEKKVPSGVYFCRLSVGSFEASRKMVVLR